MGKIRISENDQKKLRNKAKAELEHLEKTLNDTETRELLDDFKNKFNICESVYKIVFVEHQKSKGKKIGKYPKIMMTQVPHALSFAGYTFDKAFLTKLFGSSSSNKEKNQCKTVKDLRDAVTHGISGKALSEITERKDELFGYMDDFLSKIKSFDDVSA